MKLLAGYMMSGMKRLTSPRNLFWIGLVCVLLGFILPFLIVLGYLENSFGFSFFIFTLQVIGLILGVIAAAGMALEKRRKEEKEQTLENSEDDHESTTGWMK
jgi:nitrate reductase gamma subunit